MPELTPRGRMLETIAGLAGLGSDDPTEPVPMLMVAGAMDWTVEEARAELGAAAGDGLVVAVEGGKMWALTEGGYESL